MSTLCAVMAGPSRGRWVRASHSLLAGACALLGSACNIDNPGVSVPEGELNYPLLLTVSESSATRGPDWLYLANTNYNLRYRAGSLQSIDLEVVDEAMEESCIDWPDRPLVCTRAGGTLRDGQCCLACVDQPNDLLCDEPEGVLGACCYGSLQGSQYRFLPDGGEIEISSFASSMTLSSSGDALYVAVRSNDALLKVSVDGGKLDCGQGGGRVCPSDAYLGIKKPLADTDAQLARLPLALVSGAADDFGVSGSAELLFVGHDDGSVSFLRDGGGMPRLTASLEQELPGRANTLRRDPHSGLVYVSQENREDLRVSTIYRLGVRETAAGLSPFVASPLTLTGVSDNSSPRDVAFDPMDENSLYTLVNGSSGLTRSLYFMQLDPETASEAVTTDVARVGRGPARLVRAEVAGASYLFVGCYDEGSLFIFDAGTQRLTAFIRGLVGPFEFAVDGARERAYVADFASSTLRVVDLRGLSDPTLPGPRIVMTLGVPDVEGGML